MSTEEQVLINYIKQKTNESWSLTTHLAAYYDSTVIDIIIKNWDTLAQSPLSDLSESDTRKSTRKTKTGIITAFLAVTRKKLKLCKSSAENVCESLACY